MVLRGSIRGNGSQLASYFIAKRENDAVSVFDIKGTTQPDNLKKSLIEMSLTSELSGKTKKGLYHVVINPRTGEDKKMTKQQWFRAVDIIEEARGLRNQKRVMVMHEKKGRIHMHAVWERYNHETGLMICNKHSNYDLKRCRLGMEKEFGHQATADKNTQRPALKSMLGDLWQRHPDGAAFRNSLQREGYIIAKQAGRRPFVIVNAQGRSFELVKEIPGVRTRQVRDRLNKLKLPDKNEIIDTIRERNIGKSRTRERLAEELKNLTRGTQKAKGRDR